MATFDYFGEQITYADEFPDFEYAEFAEALAEDEISNVKATGVALRLAVACVAETDRSRFRKLSRQHRAKQDDWLRVFRDWTAEEAERPTGQPTDSSAGPTSIPETSESEPVASVTPIASERPVRADLALAAARSRTA